ncbi:hypothetical protein OF83DRAFT_1085296 [Amylostereum chailletii]|nr:hypothetical protein OF83DRAFT_1085296 [Amylostereum chailletii]
MFVNRRFLLISLLLLVPICISAQNFNIPSTWQVNTSSIARNDRIKIAENALRKVLGASSGTNPNSHSAAATASLLATLALNDWITGNSAYNTTVATILHKFSASHLNFQRRSNHWVQNPLNSDTLLWGLASFYAHRAYNCSLYLDTAVGVWNYAHQFFITEDQAAHGVQPTRNFTLRPQCNGHSLAGGVYFVPDVQSDDRVNTETVGAFLTLSAYLLEITSNKTYQDAANLSAAFIQNHLSKTVIFDTLNTSTCETNQGTFSYNSGFAIEGFAVLGNASSNETWTNLAHQLVATAVLFPTWTDPTGVIIEGAVSHRMFVLTENLTDLVDAKNGFKRIFVRALHEVWSRNPQDSPIAEFIASYLTVQFNSILSVATIPQSDVYSPFWKGPPPVSGKLDALSQVITSYALNSAINLPVSASRTSEPERCIPLTIAPALQLITNISGNPSGASGLATPPTSTSSKHSAAAAVIVGGVIGGLASSSSYSADADATATVTSNLNIRLSTLGR